MVFCRFHRFVREDEVCDVKLVFVDDSVDRAEKVRSGVGGICKVKNLSVWRQFCPFLELAIEPTAYIYWLLIIVCFNDILVHLTRLDLIIVSGENLVAEHRAVILNGFHCNRFYIVAVGIHYPSSEVA